MSEELSYQDAIILALIKNESLEFKKLFRTVQDFKKCTEKTFNMHLKKLVTNEIIHYTPPTKKERGKYWLDTHEKTFDKFLQEMFDRQLENWNRESKGVLKLINLFNNIIKKNTVYDDLGRVILDFDSKKGKKINKSLDNKSIILETLVKSTKNWFDLYSMYMFSVTTGSSTKLVGRTIKRNLEFRRIKMEAFFHQLKQYDSHAYYQFHELARK